MTRSELRLNDTATFRPSGFLKRRYTGLIPLNATNLPFPSVAWVLWRQHSTPPVASRPDPLPNLPVLREAEAVQLRTADVISFARRKPEEMRPRIMERNAFDYPRALPNLRDRYGHDGMVAAR